MVGPRPTLLLGGFMGTGKSTVGRVVAERAGVPFVDLDERIERAAGRSVAAIFATDGERAFRALEARALSDELGAPAPRVVAVGGGALLDARVRRGALARARVVTLAARVETILARTAGPGRPLLDEAGDRGERVAALLEARAAAYAEAHAIVDADGAPEAVAEAVLEAWSVPTVAVPVGVRSYAVRVVNDAPGVAARAARRLGPSQVFVVTDANVHALAGSPLARALAAQGLRVAPPVVLAPGEPNKQLAGIERALRAMVEGGADRDALVVSLGGGVVSDMAGFAAATLLRGVRWIAVPTTLLAMVDASVGGKTGVNLGPAKNAVGAFHQPSAVVIGPSFVATETPRAFVSGLAEVVKSAAIGDPELFAMLEREAERVLRREPAVVEELVLRSVAVKAAVVGRDERESGERALLNFGHTLGHALETEGGFERLTHGEAVALGMVGALRVGVQLGVTKPADARRVVALLARLGLPTELDREPVASALRWVALDKKRRAGAVRLVLLRAVGDATVRPCSLRELSDALAIP
jgi:shikimate kinase/3-dehydroquinate synthase